MVMILYILYTEPFLLKLEQSLTGLQVAGISQVLESYCDDVNIMTDNLNDLSLVDTTMKEFEGISGAILSRGKKCTLYMHQIIVYKCFDSLGSKIEVVKTYALSRIYYVAAILPVHTSVVQKMESLIGNFIWKSSGGLLRVAMSELHNDLQRGGLNLVCITVMCNSTIESVLKIIEMLIS